MLAVVVGVFEDRDAVVALCRPSFQVGYDRHSTTHTRPRSSNVNAIGCTMSGSPANSVALKPGGSCIVAAASSGGSGLAWRGLVLSQDGCRKDQPANCQPTHHESLTFQSTWCRYSAPIHPKHANRGLDSTFRPVARVRPASLKANFPIGVGLPCQDFHLRDENSLFAAAALTKIGVHLGLFGHNSRIRRAATVMNSRILQKRGHGPDAGGHFVARRSTGPGSRRL